jgi:hypothetical protein
MTSESAACVCAHPVEFPMIKLRSLICTLRTECQSGEL